MLQITPQMRVLVAIEAADFRRGIDGLAQLCRAGLGADPFTGTVFVFRNKRHTAVKLLVYDGQGFWLCHKRLSRGRFRWWPTSTADVGIAGAARPRGLASPVVPPPVGSLRAHELQVLLCGGDPSATLAPPEWRRVDTQPA